MASPIAGVLFDMGGTLFSYASRREMGSATGTALRRLGLDPDAPDVRDARLRASEAVHREYAAKRSFLHRDLFRERIVRTAALLGAQATQEVLDRFDAENVSAIVEHMPPKQDAASVLRALQARGIYRAIVSNADDAWVEAPLRRHGLQDLLEDWTSSEEADSCKPDTRIFTHALDKAGLDPVEVLFVGDSLQHDVAGANAAGLRTVLITDNVGPAPLSDGLTAAVEPNFRIGRLTDLVTIVDELNGSR